jgi:hypothetical protein
MDPLVADQSKDEAGMPRLPCRELRDVRLRIGYQDQEVDFHPALRDNPTGTSTSSLP